VDVEGALDDSSPPVTLGAPVGSRMGATDIIVVWEGACEAVGPVVTGALVGV